MNLLRLTLLAFALMIVFLVASLLYTLPRRPPDLGRVKSEFLRQNRSCSVEVVEVNRIEEDHMTFWIRYRAFASNKLQDAEYFYRRAKHGGWQLEKVEPDQ